MKLPTLDDNKHAKTKCLWSNNTEKKEQQNRLTEFSNRQLGVQTYFAQVEGRFA
jgi:hypothetical protein